MADQSKILSYLERQFLSEIDRFIDAILREDHIAGQGILNTASLRIGVDTNENSLCYHVLKGEVESVLSLLDKGGHLKLDGEELLTMDALVRCIKVNALLFSTIKTRSYMSVNVDVVGDGRPVALPKTSGLYGKYLFRCQNDLVSFLIKNGSHFEIGKGNAADLTSLYDNEVKAMISECLLNKSVTPDLNDKDAGVTTSKRVRI